MNAGKILAVLVAGGLLAWLYMTMKPASVAPVARVAAPAPTAPSAKEAAAEYGAPPASEFEIVVANGQLTTGGGALRVAQGAHVLIRVKSDRADELHLHGYDLEVPLRAGAPGVLAFTADKAGRFDLELHHASLELGALEVSPR